jgi:cell division protein FtsB
MNIASDRRKLQFYNLIVPILITALGFVFSVCTYVVVNKIGELGDKVESLVDKVADLNATLQRQAEHQAQTDLKISDLQKQDQWLLDYINKQCQQRRR